MTRKPITIILLASGIMYRGSLRGIEEGTFFSNYPAMGYGGLTYVYMPLTVINLCKVIEDEGYIYRLINDKTGWADRDRYFWNQAPSSKNVRKKADYIKQHGKWQKVREQYLSLKNKYLTMNDPNHPSFICYVEAVNNVYNTRNHWK